jgi:hypothetical protein
MITVLSGWLALAAAAVTTRGLFCRLAERSPNTSVSLSDIGESRFPGGLRSSRTSLDGDKSPKEDPDPKTSLGIFLGLGNLIGERSFFNGFF